MNRAINSTTKLGDGLTERQRELLSHFNNLDDDAQKFIVDSAARYAISFPRQRPQLKLVAGGAA